MKKLTFVIVLLALLAPFSRAQTLNIKVHGDKLPPAYLQRIQRNLEHQIGFFSRLGLPDTLTIHMYAFKDRDQGNKFLRQYMPTAYDKYIAGVFVPAKQIAIIPSMENMDRVNTTICHEICHFLLHKSFGEKVRIPDCLNEGLASWYGFLNVKKNGEAQPIIDPQYLSDAKSRIQLGEVDPKSYCSLSHSKFQSDSRHDSGLTYHICCCIIGTIFDAIGEKGMHQIIDGVKKGIPFSEMVNVLYPGGLDALNDGMLKYIEKHI